MNRIVYTTDNKTAQLMSQRDKKFMKEAAKKQEEKEKGQKLVKVNADTELFVTKGLSNKEEREAVKNFNKKHDRFY